MTLHQNMGSPQPPDDELVQVCGGFLSTIQGDRGWRRRRDLHQEPEWTIPAFNRSAAQFVGRPVEGVPGKKAGDLCGEEAGKKIRKLELEVMETGVPSTVEETIESVGTMRTFLTTCSPYRDEQGKIIGMIGIARDITEKKRVERELHQSQLR